MNQLYTVLKVHFARVVPAVMAVTIVWAAQARPVQAAKWSADATNSPPSITVAGGSCLSNSTAAGSINLIISDANTRPAGLMLSLIKNSNPALVPDDGIQLVGSAATRRLIVTAAAKQAGSARLTIGVYDGTNISTAVVNVVVGTGNDETLNGTVGPDMLFGLNGANTLNGLGGNDLLCGGNADDTLTGGNGDDTLYGYAGADTLDGGSGSDSLVGKLGADRFAGGAGQDTVTDCQPNEGDTHDNMVENLVLLVGGAGNSDLTD